MQAPIQASYETNILQIERKVKTMTKKIAIIFISLVVLFAIGVGIYLSLGKKPPVSPQTPPTQQIYTNPVFSYTLNIPAGYEVQSPNSPQASTSGQPIKADNSCIVRKSDNSCILPLEAVFDDTKPSISTWLLNPPEYFKTFSLTKTKIGAYEAATWETDSDTSYLFMDNGLVLRVHFLSKNSDVAKTILNTIKLKN